MRPRPPVHLLEVRSPVLDSTDFVLHHHMLLLLNIWYVVRHLLLWSEMVHCDARLTLLKLYRNSLILGILYLTFQAFPIIFEGRHGFNMQSTGLTFLGMAIGMLLGLCTQPYWNRCGDLPGNPNKIK